MSDEKNPFVSIAATVGIIALIMIIVIVMFSPQNIWVTVPFVAFMCLLGIMLGHFASKRAFPMPAPK